MTDSITVLKDAVLLHASDIFLIPGLPLSYKINGRIEQQHEEALMPDAVQNLVRGIYDLAPGHTTARLDEMGDDDFSISVPDVSRYRVNAFKQRGSYAAVIRVVNFSLPDYHELNIPDAVINIADRKKGFILVTGPAGSGKSTTLACIIDEINKRRSAHVITMEDPIEYLHRHKKSIVTQREVGLDTESYLTALRASLRQAPDVILLGEMRDYETIKTAMTAAETGHLVISTLHTVGAANTVDRIIDSFPASQQQQIRIQLAMVLEVVVSQQLIPTIDQKEVPAFEIMVLNNAIRNLIRESKIHQIDAAINSSSDLGMVSMDSSLFQLYKKGSITAETALSYAVNPALLQRRL